VRSSSNERGGQGGSEARARYTAALLISVDYLLTGEHMPYSSHTGDSWQPTNDTGRPASVGDILVKAKAVATTKQPGQGDAGYVAWSLSAMPVLTRWLMQRRADLGDRLTSLRNIGRGDTWHGGGDEKKCREVGTDAKEPLKSVFTGSCGGMRSELLGTEEEKRCEVGRDVKEPVAGGPMGGRGGTCSERLATEEEKRCVSSRLETTRAGEDLLTTVKTNLPMPRAIGKRTVILAFTLLHFCGGAQALNLPTRGLPGRGRPSDSSTGAGRGLAAALGCVPLGQAEAPPLRVVENKHNCTSLLTGGEMLQQHAWTPQRALLQAGKGQDSSALLRALGGAIMHTWVRRLYASVTPATPPCYRQADVTTETNRHARLRTCLPGRSRLHLISRHHIRQLGISVRRASNRSGGGEEAMPISLNPRVSVSSTSKPITAGPRQGDTSGWKRNRSQSQIDSKPGKKHMGGPKSQAPTTKEFVIYSCNICGFNKKKFRERECVVYWYQFSILYTFMYSPA
jgi:hypothetical protein